MIEADVNSSLLELIGCIEAVMYFLEENSDVEAVLICDNQGICNMVKNGFSEDPAFDLFVKKLIALKAKGRISGPFFEDRTRTFGADSMAKVGEELYKEMRSMERFLFEVGLIGLHSIAVQEVSKCAGTIESAAGALSPTGLQFLKFYMRFEELLKEGAIRLGSGSTDPRLKKPDLAVAAVVAAHISTIASFLGEEVNPHGFEVFERFLLSCSKGEGSLTGMLGWYYPANNLFWAATSHPKATADDRLEEFLRCSIFLERLFESLPREQDSATEDDCGGGDPGRTVGVSLAQDAAIEHDCGGGDPARAVGASLAQLFKDLSITADQKKIIKEVLYGYYDTMVEVLQAEHASLRHVEHDNAKILNSKGELSDDNASSYEKLRKCCDNLYRGVSFLAEALDIQPPVMPEDGHTTRVTSGDDSASSASGKESSTVEPVWDGEDARTVYECLPDLRAFVPEVPLGESESKGNEPAKVNSFNLPNFVRNQLNKLLKWASTFAGGDFERKESDGKQA